MRIPLFLIPASLASIGTPFGCLLSACMTDAVGRKKTLIFTEIPAIIGWIVIAASPTVECVYLGRILTGVTAGMIGAPARVYTAEVTQPHLRGFLAASASVGTSFGKLRQINRIWPLYFTLCQIRDCVY